MSNKSAFGQRVDKRTPYGTTEVCAACGGEELKRRFVSVERQEILPHEWQYMLVTCENCGWDTEERPLFLRGNYKRDGDN